MKPGRTEFLAWGEPLTGSRFLMFGAMLTALKLLLDLVVASTIFGRPWSPLNYLLPGSALGLLAASGDDQVFFGTMLLVALPFLPAGLILTHRRMIDSGMPVGLLILFFVPVINLLFFAVLAVLPSVSDDALASEVAETIAEDPGLWPVSAPDPDGGKPSALSKPSSVTLAIFLAAGFGVAVTVFGTLALRDYGWGLFLGIPFAVGLIATLMDHRPPSKGYGRALSVANLALIVYGTMLLCVAIEGLVCLVMAWPIAAVSASVGGLLGWSLKRSAQGGPAWIKPMLVVMAALPGLMGAERAARQAPTLFAVRTAVEVDAPPEQVWRDVVTFGTIPPPTDWILRSGIAYPTHAEIDGTGVGAVRRCVFTTGTFVEPIEVWDEPRLLRFSVTSSPPPMREWSPWATVKPPHLENFLVSQGGQFRLVPLPGGGTRLEGTTWYRHHMSPEFYWRFFSNAIVHRIHLRVLEHVKTLAESD